MEQIELKKILSSAYSIEAWKPILTMLFGNKIEYLAKSRSITEERIKNGGHIGNIRLDDGKNIAIFDMEVADSINIRKNRKGLRDIAADYIDQALTHAALVFYHSSSQADYRLTYIAKQTYFTPEGEFVAKETAPKRYTFLLGKNESCTTAAIRMLELAEKRKRGTIYLVDVTDTFSVEKLNDDFFNRYKKFYREFCLYIIDNENCRNSIFDIEPKEELNHKLNKPIRDFVKKMMGRIVFLHFLQKKGWMGCSPNTLEWRDGDKEFMLNLFNGYQAKNHFYSKCLTELFFNTLNNNARGEEQIFQLTGTRVPYLNGGLFDEDLPKARNLDFSATLFGDFLNFFGEYNFTIDENSPEEQEVGIDPEMLGHIFENLLEDNKDKGTFYTPKEIVYYMCKESLLHYLCSHTEDSLHPHLATLVRDHKLSDELQGNKNRASKIDNLLMGVKICDPAIGSGAFPMGMLHEIFSIRRKLYPELLKQGGFDPARVKKEIIQHSIHGVDIEKGAVDIARLRFWLALVVDEEKPIPLPNLDFKIMQGDSLLERYKNTDLSKILEEEDDSIYAEQGILNFGDDNHLVREVTIFDTISRKELQELIDKYFDFEQGKDTRYNTKYDVKAKIYSIIEGKLLAVVMQEKFKLESELNKLQTYIEGNRITDIDTNAGKKIKESNLKKINKQIESAEAKFVEVKESIEHLKKLLKDVNAEKPYFLWHTFFKDIFDNGGFDIVIGNPPYVEAKKLKELSYLLKKDYTTYSGTADLSVYFIEQGLKLCKAKGYLSYITTNKFFNTGYGKPVRDNLLTHTIAQILNFEQVEVFKDILVSSVILSVAKQKTTLEHNFKYKKYYKLNCAEFKKEFVASFNLLEDYEQSKLYDSEWSFANDSQLIVKDIIQREGVLLKDLDGVSVYRGVTTGYNPAFIIDDAKRDELIAKDPANKDIIKNMLQGRNIRKWTYNESDENLIFTKQGIDIDKFPLIRNHLNGFYSLLKPRREGENGEGRKPGSYEWYEIQDNTAYYPEFEQAEKIIWGLTADKWAFAYDDKQHYLPSNGYILTSDSISIKYLLALLNSNVLKYYFGFIGVMTAGGAYTLKHATIQQLPIKLSDREYVFITLVDYILFAKTYKDNISDLVSNEFIAKYFEEIIDGCVYELYFENHMRELEINILEEVEKRIKPIGHLVTEKEKATVISDVFTEIKKTDNPIRTRLELFATRSTDILKPIIEG